MYIIIEYHGFMALNIKMQLLFVCIYLKFYFFFTRILFLEKVYAISCISLKEIKIFIHFHYMYYMYFFKNLFSLALFLFRYNWINDRGLSNCYNDNQRIK